MLAVANIETVHKLRRRKSRFLDSLSVSFDEVVYEWPLNQLEVIRVRYSMSPPLLHSSQNHSGKPSVWEILPEVIRDSLDPDPKRT